MGTPYWDIFRDADRENPPDRVQDDPEWNPKVKIRKPCPDRNDYPPFDDGPDTEDRRC